MLYHKPQNSALWVATTQAHAEMHRSREKTTETEAKAAFSTRCVTWCSSSWPFFTLTLRLDAFKGSQVQSIHWIGTESTWPINISKYPNFGDVTSKQKCQPLEALARLVNDRNFWEHHRRWTPGPDVCTILVHKFLQSVFCVFHFSEFLAGSTWRIVLSHNVSVLLRCLRAHKCQGEVSGT